jgi:sulfatase maturation enzyme AslB (radical SAM superfamily)
MIITEKLINNQLVKYRPNNDIIFTEDLLIDKNQSYKRTYSDHIYDTCIEITTYCNQECLNCFAESSYKKSGLNMRTTDIKKVISTRISERIRFTISGGEPFLHPQIKKILEIPRTYPLANYWINTNGFINNIQDYVEPLVNNEWNIAFSIHGAKNTHNLYTKIDSYDLVESNIIYLSKYHLNTHIYSVINRNTTFSDINHLVRLKNLTNSAFLRFIVPREFGRVDINYDNNIIDKIPATHDIGIKRCASNTEFVSINGISRLTN